MLLRRLCNLHSCSSRVISGSLRSLSSSISSSASSSISSSISSSASLSRSFLVGSRSSKSMLSMLEKRAAWSSCSSPLRLGPLDPVSFAHPHEAMVTHIDLELDVDFDQSVLEGHVVLSVKKMSSRVSQLLLDVSNDLVVKSVCDFDSNRELEFSIDSPSSCGSRLAIALNVENHLESRVKITYNTSPLASALQWLPKEQTAGKRQPYLFSQCQAIHCRSMIPLQDTPAVKATYSAKITAPKALTVLMSAVPEHEGVAVDEFRKQFVFNQPVPIQSYLIAIAVGELESRKLGPRSRVWSEKEIVDKAAYEFAQTEDMLKTAEELCGPYVWGIYDILVLPPSFPFGGMENPCLTFATPTLLAGDRSLANVIAHEIAHSWTGNLVTNVNFEHFWLNEGFTVFTERKIIGRLNDERARHFEAIGGWKDLSYQVNDVFGSDHDFTKLIVDLSGPTDPDEAFSTVPYEKGAAFLWYLEETVGGPSVFEPFLRKYYDTFKFKSIDSNAFKDFFMDYFKDQTEVKTIDWDAWFYNTGMPLHKPHYDDTLSKACVDLKNRWVAWDESEPAPFSASDLTSFSSDQTIELLAELLQEKPLSLKKLETMDRVYEMSSISNSEIRFRWIRLGLLGHYKPSIELAVQMVSEQGRMKFLRPLYRDLFKWPEAKQTALDTFNSNKGAMMAVAVGGVANDLQLAKP